MGRLAAAAVVLVALGMAAGVGRAAAPPPALARHLTSNGRVLWNLDAVLNDTFGDRVESYDDGQRVEIFSVAHGSYWPTRPLTGGSRLSRPTAVGGVTARTNPGQYLSTDAAHRTVHLTLLAGLGVENNGFNFDGYGRGELSVHVPVGWRVVVDCENRGEMPHSCAIVANSLALRPAFRGAASPHPLTGLRPGSKVTFSFTPNRAGSFRIACLVPGHEQARMWDVLEVTRGGKPGVTARPGP